MVVLSMKPLQKLTGTDRQAGRQADGRTDKPVYGEAAPPKTDLCLKSNIRVCQLKSFLE